jgi:colicin import membrane protein
VLLHSGLIAWAYLIMLSTPKLEPPEPEPITVALITPSELLQLKKGSETAKELEAKAKDEPKPAVSKQEAEKPKPVAAPTPPEEPAPPVVEAKPPPPPEPPKADAIAEKLAALPPEPAPGPTPEELRQIEEQKKAAEEERKKAAEKRKAEEKKKSDELKKKIEQRKRLAEAKRQAEAKKKSAADRLAALLDKDPTKKGAPQSAEPPVKDTTYTGPTAGAREGAHAVLSAREQDLLRGQISAQLRECWKLPGGGGGIETTVVTIRWHLRPDGSLDGEPAIEQPQSGPVFQIAAEAAIRAIKTCVPFTLPPDKYASWKTIIWDFDPREMM